MLIICVCIFTTLSSAYLLRYPVMFAACNTVCWYWHFFIWWFMDSESEAGNLSGNKNDELTIYQQLNARKKIAAVNLENIQCTNSSGRIKRVH